MEVLKIFPPLIDFGVISLIGLKTLNTKCFSPIDINLSLGALVFSIIKKTMGHRTLKGAVCKAPCF